MKSFTISAKFVFLLIGELFAQTDSQWFYYPLNIGDSWEYRRQDFSFFTIETRKVIGDTLVPNENVYRIIEEYSPPFGINYIYQRLNEDSTGVLQYYSRLVPPAQQIPDEFLLYKLKLKVGDSWKVPTPGGSDSSTFLVTQIADTSLWLHRFKFANISSQEAFAQEFILVDSIGIFWEAFEGGYYQLRGAIINGRQFGTITSIKEPPSNSSSWSFYPLKIGNSWRYKITGTGITYFRIEKIVDSLRRDGDLFWAKKIQTDYGSIDTTFILMNDSTFIKERPGFKQFDPLRCKYKIDAIVGESWLAEISPDDSLDRVTGRLESNCEDSVFGENRRCKIYRFRRERNGELYSEWFELITEGLGFTSLRGGDGFIDFDDVDLIGAIIDGVPYGETVAVDDDMKNTELPELFFISYPNPFTTTTVIDVYSRGFGTTSDLQIAIYNLIGQQIRTIYDGAWIRTQPFRAIWDGRDNQSRLVPSGIYFLQIRSGNSTINKRAVFLR